jgi:hypothetical protein
MLGFPLDFDIKKEVYYDFFFQVLLGGIFAVLTETVLFGKISTSQILSLYSSRLF